MPASRNRRMLAAAAVLLVVAVVAFFLFRRTREKAARRDGPAPAATQPAPARRGPSREAAPPAQRASIVPAASDAPPLQPIIDEVILEKTEVCRGEENLVTVKAHTPEHREDAYLHYFVSSEIGSSVPLRLTDRSDEARGDVVREVIVFGRNNVATSVPLPPYTIKDCDVERQLTLAARLLPNTESELEFTARIRDIAAAEPMQPIRYRWSFGDGSTAETEHRFTSHDYGARPQDTMFSNFVVTCEAIAADGERVVGRAAVELLNPAFEELAYKQLVRLSTAMTPRFPELDDQGRVIQEVSVWHHRPDPVRLTRVVVVTNYLPDPETGALRAPRTDVAEPDEILGVDRLLPSGITARMTLDTTSDANVLSRDYLIEGKSAEGWTAHGNFSLMRPPPKPTAENSRPVLSKHMEAKIRRAIEITGKRYVTDEDIWSLERMGYMDDLRVEDFPPAEPEPEPPRSPAGRAPALPPPDRSR